MIPLKINGKQLCEIFTPSAVDALGTSIEFWTDQQKQQYSYARIMYPTAVTLTAETYSRNAERSSDKEMSNFKLINRKASPVFEWELISASYVENLLTFLEYKTNYKNGEGIVIPIDAPIIEITYRDFAGLRTINTYLGQALEGTLVENESGLYWENFRIAFPER